MEKNKKDIIKLLEKIALYLELKGENNFRISAYRRAAQALERDERSLSEIDDFTKIKGIGKGTNAIIIEYIENHTCELLAELEREIPEGLIPLLQVPGLGGKRIAKLYQELGIIDAASLKAACESGDVEKIPGFGKTSSKNILKSLLETNRRPERIPIAVILPIAEKVEAFLTEILSIKKFSRAGSLRRVRETIRDIDFIIATDDPVNTSEAILAIENIKEIVAHGETKVSIIIEDIYDINIDFRLVSSEDYATTLHHFTGSKEHNIAMRQIAKERGEKINEYGVECEETGKLITFTSEEEFFHHFDLNYIPPEVRENSGEIDAFKHKVDLIETSDIRGDLHMHTTWSDGAQSIEEMIVHAKTRGYEYVAITDHSKFLRVANGLDEDRLKRQREEILKLREKHPDIHIFAGIEMDILPDSTLDFSNELLSEMDFVIGAIHSSFNQSKQKIMDRLFRALENPYVHLIAHPTGRIIGSRDGYRVDIEKLIDKAIETGIALEINANPNRFDLSSEWAKIAQEAGALLAINTDAHSLQGFDYMKYGVAVAKKGWINKDTVINTWSLRKLRNHLERNKR